MGQSLEGKKTRKKASLRWRYARKTIRVNISQYPCGTIPKNVLEFAVLPRRANGMEKRV